VYKGSGVKLQEFLILLQDPEVSAVMQKQIFNFSHQDAPFLRWFAHCQLVIPLFDITVITANNIMSDTSTVSV
jgi:hypothetical protein